ncbi:MAG: 4Fe-4S binding protein [Nitrospirae bacterium]|nr:4Fe-4S binding protein [Nitrospirota bacterium]
MAQDHRIYHNRDRCIGCHACEIHCKTENDVPVGLKLCTITKKGPEVVDGIPRVKFQFKSCFHCKSPACMKACQSGAIVKREEDGLVILDASLCTGCKSCIEACHWHVPQWNAKTGKAMKCNMCLHRLDEGLHQACVTGCPTKAMSRHRPG